METLTGKDLIRYFRVLIAKIETWDDYKEALEKIEEVACLKDRGEITLEQWVRIWSDLDRAGRAI